MVAEGAGVAAGDEEGLPHKPHVRRHCWPVSGKGHICDRALAAQSGSTSKQVAAEFGASVLPSSFWMVAHTHRFPKLSWMTSDFPMIHAERGPSQAVARMSDDSLNGTPTPAAYTHSIHTTGQTEPTAIGYPARSVNARERKIVVGETERDGTAAKYTELAAEVPQLAGGRRGY